MEKAKIKPIPFKKQGENHSFYNRWYAIANLVFTINNYTIKVATKEKIRIIS